MKFETEGIILKQTKTATGGRMVVLLCKKYGKINAGSSAHEGGRNKSALAIRPFTYGRYEIFKNRDSYVIDRGETIKSFYSIGEDVDKYMAASYALEFTERALLYEEKYPSILALLLDFLRELEIRESRYKTLIIAYQLKVLESLGVLPNLETCVECGEKNEPKLFSISDGGIVCKKCAENIPINTNDSLIYSINFDIVNVLKYFVKKPLSQFRSIALQEEMFNEIEVIIKKYVSYHLDMGDLKSEAFIKNSF